MQSNRLKKQGKARRRSALKGLQKCKSNCEFVQCFPIAKLLPSEARSLFCLFFFFYCCLSLFFMLLFLSSSVPSFSSSFSSYCSSSASTLFFFSFFTSEGDNFSVEEYFKHTAFSFIILETRSYLSTEMHRFTNRV